MLILGRRLLDDFARRHAQSRPSIRKWVENVTLAEWIVPQHVRELFSSADFLPENRVVFNLSGNKFRLLAQIDYETGRVLILRIGTHQEYDRWDL